MPACEEPSTGVLHVGIAHIRIVCVCVYANGGYSKTEDAFETWGRYILQRQGLYTGRHPGYSEMYANLGITF